MKQAGKYALLFAVCFLTYFGVRYFAHDKIQIIESLLIAAVSVVVVLVMNRKKQK